MKRVTWSRATHYGVPCYIVRHGAETAEVYNLPAVRKLEAAVALAAMFRSIAKVQS